jgi:CRISPR-associated protein Cmr6
LRLKIMIKGLENWAKQNNIPVKTFKKSNGVKKVLHKLESKEQQSSRPIIQRAQATARERPNEEKAVKSSPDSIPMMFRAQVSGRCSLMYASESGDRNKWLREWKHHRPYGTDGEKADYQYQTEDIYEENSFTHSFKVEFPYRVLTNSGQDSILRPPIGGHGIPYIPGSSIKGILRKYLKSQYTSPEEKEKLEYYCGTSDTPGKLRFHGAFPLGDWSNNCLDVVHPQQKKQVEGDETTSAYALISFYKPNFIIEISSSDDNITSSWGNIETLIRMAMRQGLGGKTSTGYGYSEKPYFADSASDNCSDTNVPHFQFQLSGKGISSVLLNKKTEFRPNCFKASLRGHVRRLLAGVCSTAEVVNKITDELFGSTEAEANIQIYWESEHSPQDQTYDETGTLHLAARHSTAINDLEFIRKVLKFAYIMGGFGKSWRRVWHKDFYPSY